MNSATFPIGIVEIVEVSDVVVNEAGAYTVGFKYRLRPNAFGELFDFKSAIHKSLPPAIQQNFKLNLLAPDQADKRVLSMFSAMGTDGLTRGHAELIRSGFFSRKWRIAKVYLDQLDRTEYTFHRVE